MERSLDQKRDLKEIEKAFNTLDASSSPKLPYVNNNLSKRSPEKSVQKVNEEPENQE